MSKKTYTSAPDGAAVACEVCGKAGKLGPAGELPPGWYGPCEPSTLRQLPACCEAHREELLSRGAVP